MPAPIVLMTGAAFGIGRATVADVATRCGRLDAVVNKAGSAADGIFEAADGNLR